MENDLVKQDRNFLEHPTWFLDERMEGKLDGFTWKDLEGYTYRSTGKPPSRTDFIFLLYLLMRSQNAGWSERLELTRYEILEGCSITPGKTWYERLTESLKRWEGVRIEFEGSFYDQREYQTLHFGVIDSWGIEKATKKLKIRFSSEWLLKIEESTFFKMLDFGQIKTLRSPLATRLYEILCKNFEGRDLWKIDALKLAAKIPMAERHPAHIVPKLQVATARIARGTSLNVVMDVEKERGKATLIFRLLPKKALPIEEPTHNPELEELLSILPDQHKGKATIVGLLSEALKRYGVEHVRRNLRYAAMSSKGSFRGFLTKALAEDWGKALSEDEAAKMELQRAEQEKVELLEAERKQQREREKIARERFEVLGDEARRELREKALQELPAPLRRSEKSIVIMMRAILERELDADQREA